MDIVQVREVLAGCTGIEQYVRLLNMLAPGPPLAGGGFSEQFNENVGPLDGPHNEWFTEMPSRGPAVADVLGWRQSAFGQTVVTYRGVDEREYDIVATIDAVTGKFAQFRHMRSSGGADVGAKPITELSEAEHRAVRTVFDHAYLDADHSFLDRRLASLSTIGLAWRDDTLLAFSAVGLVDADLPALGPTCFLDCGILCVDPTQQTKGLSNAVGNVALQGIPRTKRHQFNVLHFGTPVTLRATLTFARSVWPGNTIGDVAAAMHSPTACQRDVGAAIAALAGAESYDADHWILRMGTTIGESTARPEGLEPEYDELFRHVDRSKGDALLGLWWGDPPPPVWTR